MSQTIETDTDFLSPCPFFVSIHTSQGIVDVKIKVNLT